MEVDALFSTNLIGCWVFHGVSPMARRLHMTESFGGRAHH